MDIRWIGIGRRRSLVFLATLLVMIPIGLAAPSGASPPGSWNAEPPPSGGPYDAAAISCPTATNCEVVGGSNTVIATTDGGATWVSQTVPSGSELTDVSCASSADCVAVGFKDQVTSDIGVIIATTNGGATWTSEPVPSGVSFLSAVTCATTTDCIAGGAYRPTDPGTGVVLATADGGTAWTSQNVPAGVVSVNSIACPTATACVATITGYQSNVMRTTDGGTTWVGQTLPTSLVDVSCVSASDCLGVSGNDNGSAITDDGGATWTLESTAHDSLTAVSCISETDCVAVGRTPEAEVIAETTNGGFDWGNEAVPSDAVGLGDVACASSSACMAVGAAFGDASLILTSSNAFGPFPSTTSLAVSPKTTPVGSSVRYIATIAGQGGTPTGTVTFTVGTTRLCTAGLSGGEGSCTSTHAPVGADTVTANYSGDVNFTPSRASAGFTVDPLHGYWLVAGDGGIFTFGSATFHGSTGNLHLQRPVVGMTTTTDDDGYWMVATDGGMFGFGDAKYHGSLPGLGFNPAGSGLPHSLDAPIDAMVASPTGHGYLLVARDGGVFAFGDALFHGSCPEIGGCNGSVVAVVPDTNELGYWVVTSTGHVYNFGNAADYGQPGPTAAPITGAVAAPGGHGYLIVNALGDVYTFGKAPYYGAAPGGVSVPSTEIVGIVPTSGGYWLFGAEGAVYPYGDAPNDGSMAGKPLNSPIVTAAGF